MFRHILSVGGLTLASRVLGFLRDVLTAALLGAGPVADAFFVAFRLPNHFRALFAEGAFNSAFVPLFSAKLVQDGAAAARRFADEVMTLLAIVQVVLLLAVLAFMPQFMTVFAPGFADEPEKFRLAVLFTSITFPYLLLISLVSLYGGVLNSMSRFGAAAAAPILMNLCLIAALVLATPLMPSAGHALSWGVLASGVAQYVYLAWDARRAGMALRPVRPRLSADVKRFLAVLGPAALGSGLTQISLFADTLIASALPTGAVSYLYYADRLNQLPLGVIGIAVGTVLLPEMSRRIKGGDEAGAVDSQNRAIELSLVLTLPAAVAFLVAGTPILSVLFQRGAFGPSDAAASALTLQAYALGLPAFVVIRSLVNGFYARHDTATPVRVALAAVGINVALKLALMGPLAQVGLAVATSVGAWVNAGLLAWLLHRRGLFRADARLTRNLPRMALAAAAMAAALWLAGERLSPWLGAAGIVERLGGLVVLAAVGLGVYAAAAALLGLVRRSDLARLRRRRAKA
ncbi:murein biosynthesis integral membrane protein MurJ [Azospirillum picis]|uniref:Probable lipid II flippase MurJ n=1 Tax=Azospirillum picis TaxID=488438 RepID=A0ABU0MLW0_9PROT|nr:murein biosynthesis integral membrane protein MurJ [Azospirillum picis]MBP2300488.1 putative peptidoglycan lipid II flippase [Azospirillum picis]MDQ0534457.1 putative peptidoglycan lipid II flippase [Azospirillum picis]